jgi:hypothetical protein
MTDLGDKLAKLDPHKLKPALARIVRELNGEITGRGGGFHDVQARHTDITYQGGRHSDESKPYQECGREERTTRWHDNDTDRDHSHEDESSPTSSHTNIHGDMYSDMTR